MGECQECKHWAVDNYQPIDGVTLGKCVAAVDINTVEHDGPIAWVVSRAFPADHECYAAELYTEAAFGCVQFEGK